MGGYTPGNAENPFCTQPVVTNIAVGGPLGPNGYFSGAAVRTSANGNQGCIFASAQSGGAIRNTGAWGNFFQDNTNWVAEVWYLPSLVGAGGNNGATPIFSTCVPRSSQGWVNGAALMCINGTNRLYNNSQNDGNVWVRLQTLCPPSVTDTNGNTLDYYVGPPVQVKTPTNSEWMHFAIVRDTVAGTLAWYTNGVMVASTPLWRTYFTNAYVPVGMAGMQDSGYGNPGGGGAYTGPDGNTHIGFDGAAQRLQGYSAEVRVSAFNPGEFSVTNLLTRRIAPGSPVVWYGPTVVADPQNMTVVAGSAAPFRVVAATDTSLTYQWQRLSGTWGNISGATNEIYIREGTSVGADNGAQFRCILTKPVNSLSRTSAVATLTVIAGDPGIANGYSNAVMSEATLLAYFPVDGTTSGTNLVNVKDATHNGTMLNTPFAFRNGNTNWAAGNQALSLNMPDQGFAGGFTLNANRYGYVEIPGNVAGYDFSTSGGNGTIEAVLYMEPSSKRVLSSELLCWFSSCLAPNATDYYQFLADYNGNIYYQNSQNNGANQLVWVVPGGLAGKRTHIAVVFQAGKKATCYANGVSLGTKTVGTASVFGNSPPSASQALTIGKRGGENPDQIGYMPNLWRGTVDDLAIYGSALSANTVASHFFILNNGTTPTPPSIAKLSPSKSLYAGFPKQILNVVAAGSPPFSYQWRSNGVPILGATNPTLTVLTLPVNTYSFSVVVSNTLPVSLGSVTSAPVVLTVVAPIGYANQVYHSSGGPPLAFYPLNETSGTTIYDWSGTHDGVIYGNYLMGTVGPVPGDGCIKMYGTDAGDTISRIEVPFYPELNSYKEALDADQNGALTAYDGRMSIEFWYRPDDTVAMCAVSSQFNIGNNRAGAAIYLGYTGNDGDNQTTYQYWTMRLGRFNNTNQGTNQNGQGGPTRPPVGEWCHVALVVDTAYGGLGNQCLMYVNGAIDDIDGTGYSTDPNAGFSWNANNLAPLIMGNRNNGQSSRPMNGALSQVAIYDYPLTIDDVKNHLSKIYTNATFTSQPVGTTNMESVSATFTLTANATGIPNSYQWVKDGVELTPTNNWDGTEHYPIVANTAGQLQGPLSKTLVINQLKPSDSGLYWLRIFNQMNSNNVPPGQTNSLQAKVLITNDTIVPVVTDVSPRGTTISGAVLDDLTYFSGNPTPAPLFMVEAKFSKRMEPATATNKANYAITGPGGVQVTNVVQAGSVYDTKFGADWKTVGLITSGLQPGSTYTVTVSNVRDQAQTPNVIAPATFSFTAPSLRTNVALWSYYYRVYGPANGLDSLASQTNAGFPYVPQATWALTNFSSDAVAPNQNLGNNSLFSGESDYFASTITAWVTPTNTGYYEFFITADDNARLYLNYNGADPAGAYWIGESYSSSTTFNDIYAIPNHYLLTKGQSYFMEAVHTENNGSDQVRVGWRYLGTEDLSFDGSGNNGAWTNQASTLPPIEGKFLSAYNVGPTINTQPISIVAAAGTTTNLAVNATTATGLATYQWQVNNGNTGANSNKLFFAPVAFGNYSTNYRVIISDGALSVTSAVVSVTPPAPTFVTSPTNKAVPRGLATSIAFVPSTYSGQTNYQWQLSSANVPAGGNYGGTTAQTLTIASMNPTNVGPYKLIVNDGFTKNASGGLLSLTSSVANLTIASNPVVATVRSGSSLSLQFPSELGPQYVTEWKGALTNGAWSQMVTNAGTGGLITVTTNTLSPQRFFRIRMQ